ncbi:MAG: hypothetical protein KatS3mg001_075 [Candidatus Pacearchaeota archaeon]|nr:MAG: hypothetical protein KatS3mg001_075 [Candidatus Pacearchaeota archaeon]
MKIHIEEEKENKIFERKEIRGKIESEKIPSREELLDILSKNYKTDKENIKIASIKGSFGSRIFNFEARIYKNKEQKNLIEFKKKKEAELEKKQSLQGTQETNLIQVKEESIEENTPVAS